MSINNIIKTLDSYEQLSGDETTALQQLKPFMKHTTLKKGQYLFQEGDIPDMIYYIEFGLMRRFLNDTNDNEKIIQFYKEEDFVHDCNCYYEQRPIDYFVQALEDCDLVYFKLQDVEHLQNDFPVFEKIGTKMLQGHIANHTEHLTMLMRYNPEERYLYVLENSPELIQRLSITHLAQYLSISRETLSRMRAKICEKSSFQHEL
ncbi:MAG: Crp/Fnr family transcriptional regulator [Chitinophagales bacterium]|nr:Crp/Fnr family transcriptional regulator [Chitinophagales bacterium]